MLVEGDSALYVGVRVRWWCWQCRRESEVTLHVFSWTVYSNEVVLWMRIHEAQPHTGYIENYISRISCWKVIWYMCSCLDVVAIKFKRRIIYIRTQLWVLDTLFSHLPEHLLPPPFSAHTHSPIPIFLTHPPSPIFFKHAPFPIFSLHSSIPRPNIFLHTSCHLPCSLSFPPPSISCLRLPPHPAEGSCPFLPARIEKCSAEFHTQFLEDWRVTLWSPLCTDNAPKNVESTRKFNCGGPITGVSGALIVCLSLLAWLWTGADFPGHGGLYYPPARFSIFILLFLLYTSLIMYYSFLIHYSFHEECSLIT